MISLPSLSVEARHSSVILNVTISFSLGFKLIFFEWYQAFYRVRIIRWGIGNIKLKNDIAFRFSDVAYCRIYFIADKRYIFKWKLGVCASVSELILNITLKISVSSVLHWSALADRPLNPDAVCAWGFRRWPSLCLCAWWPCIYRRWALPKVLLSSE